MVRLVEYYDPWVGKRNLPAKMCVKHLRRHEDDDGALQFARRLSPQVGTDKFEVRGGPLRVPQVARRVKSLAEKFARGGEPEHSYRLAKRLKEPNHRQQGRTGLASPGWKTEKSCVLRRWRPQGAERLLYKILLVVEPLGREISFPQNIVPVLSRLRSILFVSLVLYSCLTVSSKAFDVFSDHTGRVLLQDSKRTAAESI